MIGIFKLFIASACDTNMIHSNTCIAPLYSTYTHKQHLLTEKQPVTISDIPKALYNDNKFDHALVY